LKVFFPDIFSWVEQACQAIGVRIATREIGSFEQIAELARQREILQIIRARVLPGNDVLDMKRPRRLERLPQPTVFAATVGSLAHL
jgi:hypothetical protein